MDINISRYNQEEAVNITNKWQRICRLSDFVVKLLGEDIKS